MARARPSKERSPWNFREPSRNSRPNRQLTIRRTTITMSTTLIRPGDRTEADSRLLTQTKRTMRIAGENLKVTIDDLVVNYDDNGPVYAPPVVFIHGTPFNKSIWDLQTEALKSNYRVISYDLRGHGDTKGPNQDLSIDAFTEDLVKF